MESSSASTNGRLRSINGGRPEVPIALEELGAQGALASLATNRALDGLEAVAPGVKIWAPCSAICLSVLKRARSKRLDALDPPSGF
jgi:hypothetical protein